MGLSAHFFNITNPNSCVDIRELLKITPCLFIGLKCFKDVVWNLEGIRRKVGDDSQTCFGHSSILDEAFHTFFVQFSPIALRAAWREALG